MRRYLCFLLAMIAPISGQSVGETAVYVATYVEVVPKAAQDGAALLKQYREALRKDGGNLRAEIVQETGRSNRFVILAIWSDQSAYEAHGKAPHAAQFRTQLKAIQSAPYDERIHTGMSVGGMQAAGGRALFVVTHVDVPPPHKDATVPLLKQLSADSRKEEGNLRFEVQQQGNRPNHFTVVEIWADERSYAAHVSAAHTRQFREQLGPMSGALYDERLYRPLD